MTWLLRWGPRLAPLARAYAGVLFCDSPWVGAWFAANTWWSPNSALVGIVALLAAAFWGRLLSLNGPGQPHLLNSMLVGLFIGAFAFLFGFGLVWYIWWLAILGALGMLLTVIARGSDDDTDYIIPAAEVERIENQRYRQLSAAMDRRAEGQIAPEPLMMTTGALTIDSAHPHEFEHPDTVGNKTFGFWLYLMTDLILFSAIFATFGVLNHSYAGGPMGKDLFDLPYTCIG